MVTIIDGVTRFFLVFEDEGLLLVLDQVSFYICEQKSVNNLIGHL